MTEPLIFEEHDPDRPAKEAKLRSLPEPDLRELYHATRAAAQQARAAADMPFLFRLVRGMKTIQRIAAERGILIRARLLVADRPRATR